MRISTNETKRGCGSRSPSSCSLKLLPVLHRKLDTFAAVEDLSRYPDSDEQDQDSGYSQDVSHVLVHGFDDRAHDLWSVENRDHGPYEEPDELPEQDCAEVGD